MTNEQYVALILDGFEKNDCLASVGAKTKQEMKRKANRWIAAESVKRESIFQMGFGLDMDDQTISKFLTLVLKEEILILRSERNCLLALQTYREILCRGRKIAGRICS